MKNKEAYEKAYALLKAKGIPILKNTLSDKDRRNQWIKTALFLVVFVAVILFHMFGPEWADWSGGE